MTFGVNVSRINEVNSPLLQQSSLVHQASVTLADDQIKALPSALVEMVPAAGVTRLLVLNLALLWIDSTAGAYSYTGSDPVTQLILGTSLDCSNYLDEGIGQAFYSQAGIKQVTIGPTTYAPSANKTIGSVALDGQNMALNLAVFGPAGDFTLGHADNTLVIASEFRVYDSILKKFLTVAESGWNEATRQFYLPSYPQPD